MAKGVLTFEEMIQLLKEVCVTDKEFIMLRHECNKMSTSNRYSIIANNIISWDNKEQIDKKLFYKCNMGQNVMTFVFNIAETLDVVNFEKGVCICGSQ